MSSSDEIYTYRGGEKLPLTKSADELVVRATPERLRDAGIADAERLSAHSSKVTAGADELAAAMDQARSLAMTDHAYYEAGTGRESLEKGVRFLFPDSYHGGCRRCFSRGGDRLRRGIQVGRNTSTRATGTSK